MVKKATPVLGFGNFFRARVATLGLNPSKKEFLDHNGKLLTGANRRLESLESLGLRSLAGATIKHRRLILDSCLSYFDIYKNPYVRWFGRFEPILKQMNVSFEKGTACHLDLVQTPTDPVWSYLSRQDKEYYLKHERWFLAEQLNNHQ